MRFNFISHIIYKKMTYILDILIEEAQFSSYLHRIKKPMWFVLKADGVKKSVNSKQVMPQSLIEIKFGARIILNLENLSSSYLTMHLCMAPDVSNPQKILIVACSKMKLESISTGKCVRFNFPLFDTMNPSKEAVLLSVQASISDMKEISKARNTYPGSVNSIYPQQPNMHVQRNNNLRATNYTTYQNGMFFS